MKRNSVAMICMTTLAAAMTACVPVCRGQIASDPLYRATGDHERTYPFAEAGADSPYRIYVPPSWNGKKRLALVVILHGSNLNHDAAFDREPAELKGIVKREADKHEFIVAAPEGYKGGEYGNMYPIDLSQYLHPGMADGPRGPHRPDRPAGEELQAAGPVSAGGPSRTGQTAPQRTDTTAPELNQGLGARPKLSPEERQRINTLSEEDVLNVIRIVEKEYGTDPSRLFLMGNSLGSIGTYSLVAKYPKMFTAIAPSDGPIDPTFYPYEKTKGLSGVMIVHGEDDTVAPIDDSELMAYLFRQQGMDVVFDPVAKGGHGNSWYIELPKIFDFFDGHAHRR